MKISRLKSADWDTQLAIAKFDPFELVPQSVVDWLMDRFGSPIAESSTDSRIKSALAGSERVRIVDATWTTIAVATTGEEGEVILLTEEV